MDLNPISYYNPIISSPIEILHPPLSKLTRCHDKFIKSNTNSNTKSVPNTKFVPKTNPAEQ
jgi:hypothetical protein